MSTCENCIHFDICNEQADGNIVELMKEPCFRFMDKDSLVEVKHGRWVGIWDMVCSECGSYAECIYDYCPNCGAKMDGERKTE